MIWNLFSFGISPHTLQYLDTYQMLMIPYAAAQRWFAFMTEMCCHQATMAQECPFKVSQGCVTASVLVFWHGHPAGSCDMIQSHYQMLFCNSLVIGEWSCAATGPYQCSLTLTDEPFYIVRLASNITLLWILIYSSCLPCATRLLFPNEVCVTRSKKEIQYLLFIPSFHLK